MKKLNHIKAKLIISDPPYYKIVKDSWDNQWDSEEEYLEWCRLWIKECYNNLDDSGSMYIYGAAPYIFDIYRIAKDIGLKFQNSIVWYFATGQGGTKKYRIEHENILFFTKTNNYIFNYDDIRVPYESKIPGGGRVHNPLGKSCGTVWRISRVQRNSKEHRGHSTQKPLDLSYRIIDASSNEGDLVLIPFAGSGSEVISCINRNRKYIAFEKYKDNYKIAKDWIEEAKQKV